MLLKALLVNWPGTGMAEWRMRSRGGMFERRLCRFGGRRVRKARRRERSDGMGIRGGGIMCCDISCYRIRIVGLWYLNLRRAN